MSVMSVNCVNITLSEKTVWELILELCIRKQDLINVTFVEWHFLPGETRSNIWRNTIKKWPNVAKSGQMWPKVAEKWPKVAKKGQEWPKKAKSGPKIVLKKCFRLQTSKY